MALISALLVPVAGPRAQQAPPSGGEGVLKPTSHPRVPGDLSQLWLAPIAAGSGRGAPRTAAVNDFVAGVKLEVDSNFARALPIFLQPSVRQGTLGHYAEYYQGLAELRLGRAADARQTFQALAAKKPVIYSNLPIIAEVLAGCAISFNPGDAKDLAEKIMEIKTDPSLTKDLVTRAYAKAEDCTWKKRAGKILTFAKGI